MFARGSLFPVRALRIRERFGLERVVIVWDRWVITEARIREYLLSVDGMGWISALRAPAIQLSMFDERHLAEITPP